MNTPCSITNCPQDFAWHSLAFREFQEEHGKPPVQRRAAGVGPHEFHIGQWWRGVLDLIRTSDPDSLSNELLTAVADLAAHKRPPRRVPRRQKMFANDLERAQFIIDFANEYGKLPRTFGIEQDPERRAGQTLNVLRVRARGSSDKKLRPIDEEALELFAEHLPEWRGPLADAPRRDTRATVRLLVAA